MAASSLRRIRFIDVLILAAIAPVIFIVAASSGQRAREVSARIACQENLRKIGLAMIMYANGETRNAQSFPRAQYEPDAPLQFFTGWDQPKTFGPTGPKPNDVTAAVFLLFKTQDIDPKVLHCPDSQSKLLVYGAGPGAAAKSIAAKSNFRGVEYLSYSFQNPYGSTHAIMSGFKWNVTLSQDFALAADMNPGDAASKVRPPDTRPGHAAPPATSPGNSPNHAGEGQNVLYADAHVEWQVTPFVGETIESGALNWRDNIYTARTAENQQTGGQIYAAPFDSYDNILLPAKGYQAPKGAK